LRVALNARNKAINPEDKGISVVKFRQLLKSKMDLLKMDYQFASRYLNEGFSGGEKKRYEILQMALLEPTLCVLDETDSGLDIDALKIVAGGVNALRSPDRGCQYIGSGAYRGFSHYPLSAHAKLHQSGLRSHHVRRTHR